jgi:peptidoglycan hydrolase-like protein with peptidoglycan-binding domain
VRRRPPEARRVARTVTGMPSLLRRRAETPADLATPARDGDGPDGPGRRRRVVPLAIGLAGAGAALATVLIASGGEDEPSRAAGTSASSAEVERRTLVARELVDGTLGYAGSRTVINRLGGGDSSGADGGDPAAGDGSGSGEPAAGGSMTLTALPRPGSVIRRGGALYRLDSEPVVLMYGSTPAYRDLEEGIEDGRDVRQLENNLVALGFDPGIVDETFTSDTAAAVSDWQESQELEETGAVELGRVAFLPGPRRVGERRASVGSLLGDGSEVLDTSSTRRVVAIELDASLQSIARTGDRVEVTLPGGSTTGGRIDSVGRVAREKAAEDAAADPNAEAQLVIDVTVELRGKRRLGRYDEAPVSVGLAQDSRKNVLAVPVNALVALRGGGYGVELAGSRRLVPVDAGMFADGFVQISGSGIRTGTRVVVPDE